MFLHGGTFHILFNMLSLWMFGTDLELSWGSRFFARYYAVTGIGAGLVTVLVSLLPFQEATSMYYGSTVGASGAIFGLLLAYGLYFPERRIYLYFLFPIPAKYFVMIFGGVALLSSVSGGGGNLAHFTHLGGLVVGYAAAGKVQSDRGVEVPLPEMEDRPHAPQVRCARGWPIGRLGPQDPLSR
jgi:membrane associated rhomboid family serine protease